MASKHLKLLLTENVDSLGIVGDVVRVRLGYARNFLLPFGLATPPSDDLIKDLATRRAEAEKQLAELRTQREAMISKLDGQQLTMTRACNDQGHLYGSVTQQDIAVALKEVGFDIKPREVRLPGTIKRIDTYDIHIKVDSDLGADVKLWVVADRQLEAGDQNEMEFDSEGELIEKTPRKSRGNKPEPAAEAEA